MLSHFKTKEWPLDTKCKHCTSTTTDRHVVVDDGPIICLNTLKFTGDQYELDATHADPDDIVFAIANTNVTKLRFGDNPELNSAHFKNCADAIRTNKTILALDLSYSNLTGADIENFCDALLTNTTVQYLDLEYNTVGPNTATAISKMLLVNNTLKKICMVNTKLTFQDISVISNAIKANTTLECFDATENDMDVTGIDRRIKIDPFVTHQFNQTDYPYDDIVDYNDPFDNNDAYEAY